METAVTRWLLVGIFVVGLVAQFVKPVGDALEDKAFLGGALLSLVAYALYSSVQRLISLNSPTVSGRVGARELSRDFEEAFEGGNVSIRFIGFTGETLVDQLLPLLEGMRDLRRSRVVRLSMILPDFREPTMLPGRIEDGQAIRDDEEFREYLRRKIDSYMEKLAGVKDDLDERNVVDFRFEIRYFCMPASLKLYVINDHLVFEGYYNRLLKRGLPRGAPTRKILDPQGYSSMLTRWHASGGKDAMKAIEAWREYFDELWVQSRR
ncbi:hypothetical protein [Streptomyces sp. NPDC059744]|uniref:hypothetical protein n=1 Tax=Streptomyces sp. NPDC059744 TaxID=3346929 RepID=UPI00364EFCDD